MIRFLGWVWWWIIPIRKKLAVANYRAAFPQREPEELRRTVGELVCGYLDLLLDRPVTIEGADRAAQGGLCLTGHGGAWDLTLIAAARHIPITIFVREPSNPVAAWFIQRLRRRVDLELLPIHDSMAAANRALEKGRLVVFVQDQRWNQGIAVPFFGRPAWTSAGFAAMAWRTRAPIFGAWSYRDEAGDHGLRFERLDLHIPEDKNDALRTLTIASQQFYERNIRTCPHSWLWLHDRWRALSEHS